MPFILLQVLSNFFRIAKDFFVICICLCHTVMSVSCSGVVICWERAYLLALLHVMFSCCCFVTFLCGVMGQLWYLIVSIPDICLLSYFAELTELNTFMNHNVNRIVNIKAYLKCTYGVYGEYTLAFYGSGYFQESNMERLITDCCYYW